VKASRKESSLTHNNYNNNSKVGNTNQKYQSFPRNNDYTFPKCSENHPLYICPYFRELNVQARRELVTQIGLCGNNLRTGHLATQCRSRRCFKCRRNHHTMLHVEIPPVLSSQPSTSASFVKNHVRMNQTVLPTVLLFISDSFQ
jgi:hypothetical protein